MKVDKKSYKPEDLTEYNNTSRLTNKGSLDDIAIYRQQQNVRLHNIWGSIYM